MCHQPDIHAHRRDFFTPACSCMHPLGRGMPPPAANNAIAPYVLHRAEGSAGFTLLRMCVYIFFET